MILGINKISRHYLFFIETIPLYISHKKGWRYKCFSATDGGEFLFHNSYNVLRDVHNILQEFMAPHASLTIETYKKVIPILWGF